LAATPLRAAADIYHLQFRAMGTDCRIVYRAASWAVAERFRERALRWLAHFEETYSRFRPDSLISRINAAAGVEAVAIDAETESLFALCDWFHWSSQGVFDPTALPLLYLWDYHEPHPVLPTGGQVERARALLGWKRVQREPGSIYLPERGMAIDLGGIGKEYAVDRVMALALEQGLQDVLVDFGHDLRVHGAPPEGGAWRIGLEKADDPGCCWGGVAVSDRAVCASGDYLRHVVLDGRTYGHVVDPRTGYPVSHGVRSVTVIAPTCTEAGMLSTTGFIMGPEEGLAFLDAYYQAEACLTLQDGSQLTTRRFMDYVI
jgi:thiamine biosynthesis lipoprotein